MRKERQRDKRKIKRFAAPLPRNLRLEMWYNFQETAELVRKLGKPSS